MELLELCRPISLDLGQYVCMPNMKTSAESHVSPLKMRQRHRTAKIAKAKAAAAPAKPKAPTAPAYSGPSTSYESRELLSRSAKLSELDRQLRLTKSSTASLGKFDKVLSGESPREKGKKRQFESNEIKDSSTERERYFAVLDSMETDKKVEARRQKKDNLKTDGLVNARKAIRAASKGKGSANLAGQEKKNKITERKGGEVGKIKSSLSKLKRGKK